MKIAIKFGDNDFYNTFEGVLQTLNAAFKWYGKLPKDKGKLCVVINNISYGCYLLFQNQFDYNEEMSGLECNRTKLYVQIKESMLFVDDELKDIDWSNTNGDIFVLDTDLDYENNKPTYSV